ncbi:MAG: UvrD-helicase domain-containing protein [Acidimicrobiales bacterium]|nr:UvrD-helicase domain-containing protein [Acidimicrobiales bacterium]MCB9393743.1 UvrD-helicase domain-containing protein [Acidimicrobiaceae bacterium]
MTATQLDLFATPELADQPARDDAIHRIDASFVMAAGAGAGKTETLIRRLEQVLARGGDPSRIVAITFTERAARDLVNKLRSKLPAALVPAVEQMTVGTIHAFCLGILRRHPLEAGLPPVFATRDELLAGTDERDRALRIRRRMFDAVATRDDPADREAIDVVVAENGIGHLDALVRLVDQQWDRFDEVAFDAPPPWRDACVPALARVRELAADRDVPLKLRIAFQDLMPRLEACVSAPTMVEALAAVPATSFGNLGGADGKASRDEVKDRVKGVTAVVRDTAVRQILHLAVPLVLDEAHARYRSGSLSFDDILVLTRRLLARHPHIRRRLRQEIDHLCVDEFQDTDVVQYDIVQALTSPPGPDDPAGTHTPVLFAVGDPKQSIYGFRDADVALFARLQQLPHLTSRELTTNFRSRPAVLRWVNALFRSWFDADAGHGQVPFGPLDHHVPDAPATVTVVGGVIDAPAELAGRAQARDLARMITAAHGTWIVRHTGGERPARFTDIAVLVRTRADLTHLEPALRRAGIPYVVEGGALLYDTREVRDLLRVLAAVNDTASPIKVVTALRTSVLAISDVELVAHRNAGGTWYLRDGDERPGHPAVLQAITALRGWADARHRTPLPELLDEVARRSATRAASLVDGAATTSWRRLRLVLDEARWWYEQTGGSLGEYLAWVALRVENDDRSNVTTDETDEDAVHVLTVHAAKGLEFPVVMVAGLGRQRPSGDHVRATFEVDADGQPRAEVKFGRMSTSGFTSAYDSVLDRLEAARLAYVACTRAMDHLVVCLHHGKRATRTTAAELVGHLPPTDEVPDLPPAPAVPSPEVVALDTRVDRPPSRATEWRVRSSWSATQLRHRDDEAPVAVPPAPAAPVATSTDVPGPLATEDAATDDTATEDAPADSPHSKPPRPFGALPDQIGRYGTRVGRAVHGVVQVLPLDGSAPLDGPSVESLVVAQCRAEEVPERFVPYVAQLVRSIATGEAFARMRAAATVGTVRREMYVGGEVDGEGVYGIVDAIWMEDGRFVVVDFKTDHVLESPAVLAERYRPQLAAYAGALRAATGREVAETLLCVARPDGEPALTVPIAV